MNTEQRRIAEEHMKRQQDQMNPPENQPPRAPLPPPPPQNCQRCESSNTKFCYYNNYSTSQPRYFCKDCKRYWTHGGTLRNVPVGGGSRKNKRSKHSTASSSSAQQNNSGMISNQSFRTTLPLPVIPPPMGNSFYNRGAIMSSLPPRINPVAAPVTLGCSAGGGGGGGQFGFNMALLQGMHFQSLRAQMPPQQFQGHSQSLSSQQNLIPSRPLSSWTQGFLNRGASNSVVGGGSYFRNGSTSGNSVEGGDQENSSYNPNHWSSDNNHPGSNPSQ
ncbi:hypothetical protein RD792_017695 [Penstemon davidsonii]|uniref:Dof zinc finger protein n=1 Tax=Penstemon davidsonii TaxID=160366 RepID=A0ABR0DW06_9LAMI|nr:hypothetical protein RD792_017695 [Penstemon davidsonii]